MSGRMPLQSSTLNLGHGLDCSELTKKNVVKPYLFNFRRWDFPAIFVWQEESCITPGYGLA